MCNPAALQPNLWLKEADPGSTDEAAKYIIYTIGRMTG
jgi:hypothetical protein